MMDIRDLTIRDFPNLLLCEIIDRTVDASANATLHENIPSQLKPWFDWFYESDDSLHFIRIKLQSGQEAYIKFLSASYYLFVLNSEENIPLLIHFLENIPSKFTENIADIVNSSTSDTAVVDTDSALLEEIAHSEKGRMEDAIRVQKMIMPNINYVKDHLKDFFVVQQQQDVVGGDFYWFNKKDDLLILALIDCSGHSLEGAMTSMACHSLLNQSFASISPTNLASCVEEFFQLISYYGQSSEEVLNYELSAEIAVFCFDRKDRKATFVSSGVASYVMKADGQLELLKPKKIINFDASKQTLTQKTLELDEIDAVYLFSDGLTDQFDETDQRKLGYKGLKKIIEEEEEFTTSYYANKITNWIGGNMQYDDITMLGAII